MSSWKVKQDFLTANQLDLIRDCIHTGGLEATTIKVRELGRVGKSGARLLLCRLARGSPLVAKLHKREDKIKQEYRAMRNVRNLFARDIDTRFKAICRSGDGVLLYWHQGGVADEQIEDAKVLNEIVYEYDDDGAAFDVDDDTITHYFHKVFGRFASARAPRIVKRRDICFKIEYKDYIREPKARKILSSILGVDETSQGADVFGTPICNPLWFIGQPCFDMPYKVKKGPVHGDLHANNVIVDADGDVHLIDFAWAANSRHVLVDYVLMENSLRFLLFPHHVNPDLQLLADTLLLKFDGAKELAKVNWNCHLVDHYRRLGLILTEVRSQARPYLASQGDDGFLEYLATQFLILFGQVSYPDYNQLMGVRALGLIANELKNNNFGGPSSAVAFAS
ncbi:MAG: hypothetical protein ABSE82_14290 [Nitrososphaerales archaeon]|jgi:hypothetical protein